jgi:guanylate kinase
MNKKLIVIGRTAAGKTSIINEMITLLENDNIPTWFFKSATNRDRRPAEDTSEYMFLSDEEFSKMNFISTFMSIDKVLKYGVLPDNDNKQGVGFFSPISQQYAIDTAKNMTNVQFVVIDLSREIRLERLKSRGESEEGINRRFAIEDLEGEYDYTKFPDNSIIIKDANLSPKEIAKIVLDKINFTDSTNKGIKL